MDTTMNRSEYHNWVNNYLFGYLQNLSNDLSLDHNQYKFDYNLHKSTKEKKKK